MQVVARYGGGLEEAGAPVILGQSLTTFLQARSVDRVTEPFVTPSSEPVAWQSYPRSDWDGATQPGWIGKSPLFDCFSTAQSPPGQPLLFWAQFLRPPQGSALWFPDDLRPATGSITALQELRLVIEQGTSTGIDRWVHESAVVSSVESAQPERLLNQPDDEGRTLVAIIMTVKIDQLVEPKLE